MPSLADRQRQFAEALLDPAAPIPHGLGGPAGTAGCERFAVYRNNVAVGLNEALRSSFPVINRLVGDEFSARWRRIMRCDRRPIRRCCSPTAVPFLTLSPGFEPALALPYLADVARLEWHWARGLSRRGGRPADAGRAARRARRASAGSAPDAPTPRHGFSASPRRHCRSGASINKRPIPRRSSSTMRPSGCCSCGPMLRWWRSTSRPEDSPSSAACKWVGPLPKRWTEALETEPGIDIAALLSGLFAAGTFVGFTDREAAVAIVQAEVRRC